MGMHPRWIKEGSVYSLTQRTIDRAFLFKPDRWSKTSSAPAPRGPSVNIRSSATGSNPISITSYVQLHIRDRIVCEVVHESVDFESVRDRRLHDFANGLLNEAALGTKVANCGLL